MLQCWVRVNIVWGGGSAAMGALVGIVRHYSTKSSAPLLSYHILSIIIFSQITVCMFVVFSLTTCKHIVRNSLSFTSLVNLSSAAST